MSKNNGAFWNKFISRFNISDDIHGKMKNFYTPAKGVFWFEGKSRIIPISWFDLIFSFKFTLKKRWTRFTCSGQRFKLALAKIWAHVINKGKINLF